jgi:pilus assembly protein Flp/PilA
MHRWVAAKRHGCGHVVRRLCREDRGAALVEYAMLIGLIAVVCVVAVTTLGTEISQAFSAYASDLSHI